MEFKFELGSIVSVVGHSNILLQITERVSAPCNPLYKGLAITGDELLLKEKEIKLVTKKDIEDYLYWTHPTRELHDAETLATKRWNISQELMSIGFPVSASMQLRGVELL